VTSVTSVTIMRDHKPKTWRHESIATHPIPLSNFAYLGLLNPDILPNRPKKVGADRQSDPECRSRETNLEAALWPF
jgi:hypothetical protein